MAGMQERDIVLQAEEGLFNEMHSGLVGRRLQAAEFTGAARFSTDSVVQELHDQPLYAKALRALVQDVEQNSKRTANSFRKVCIVLQDRLEKTARAIGIKDGRW